MDNANSAMHMVDEIYNAPKNAVKRIEDARIRS